MIEGLLLPLVALAWPLALGLVSGLRPVRPHALRLLPLAPLPALALALAPPEVPLTLVPSGTPLTFVPDLLLGTALGVEPRARLFLGPAAFLWTMAGIFAARAMARTRKPAVFAGFWCLTLSGNLGVFLALDVATFYVAFAAVSLAAYVLVVHDATPKALRAGRIYLALAVLGETCLLAGFLLALADAASLRIVDAQAALALSPMREVASALLIAGFGLKAGLVPLHVWLPLAHPAAPTAASAVLSGAIVKAGIFGLIVFLPPGLVGWGDALLALGLTGAFAAVLVGLTQTDPKAVLAYSTVSQMGLVIACIGAGLAALDPRPAVDAAALMSLHHGLAKGALFLAVGVAAAAGPRALPGVLAGVGLLALSVAGLPLTGGGAAKAALKAAVAPDWAVAAVTASGVGTALLLGRFVLLLRTKAAGRDAPGANVSAGLVLPAAALGLAALALPWLLLPEATGLARSYPLGADAVIDGLWPIALAALVGLAVFGLARLGLRLRLPAIPEGDLAVPLERASAAAVAAAARLPEPRAPAGAAAWAAARLPGIARRAEALLGSWPVAGLLAALLAVGLAVAAGLAQ
jgi:hydrogenase-4 component B